MESDAKPVLTGRPVNVRAFGNEDLTHISDSMWEMLFQNLLIDPDDTLFSVIAMIRNVLVPQNLNVLFPPKTENAPQNGGDVLVRDETQWTLAPRDWTLARIMCYGADALRKKADKLHISGLLSDRSRERVALECNKLIDKYIM